MKYVWYNIRNSIYKKKVLKGKEVSVKENLTAKRINMLEKARELHGFTNVWSQVGKIIIFGKTINKFKVFYNSNFGDVAGQLWEEKTLLVLQYFCRGFIIIG